jgi:hypothetical protein
MPNLGQRGTDKPLTDKKRIGSESLADLLCVVLSVEAEPRLPLLLQRLLLLVLQVEVVLLLGKQPEIQYPPESSYSLYTTGKKTVRNFIQKKNKVWTKSLGLPPCCLPTALIRYIFVFVLRPCSNQSLTISFLDISVLSYLCPRTLPDLRYFSVVPYCPCPFLVSYSPFFNCSLSLVVFRYFSLVPYSPLLFSLVLYDPSIFSPCSLKSFDILPSP